MTTGRYAYRAKRRAGRAGCLNFRGPVAVEGENTAPRFAVDTIPEAYCRAAAPTSHPCNFVVSDRAGFRRVGPRVRVKALLEVVGVDREVVGICRVLYMKFCPTLPDHATFSGVLFDRVHGGSRSHQSDCRCSHPSEYGERQSRPFPCTPTSPHGCRGKTPESPTPAASWCRCTRSSPREGGVIPRRRRG